MRSRTATPTLTRERGQQTTSEFDLEYITATIFPKFKRLFTVPTYFNSETFLLLIIAFGGKAGPEERNKMKKQTVESQGSHIAQTLITGSNDHTESGEENRGTVAHDH